MGNRYSGERTRRRYRKVVRVPNPAAGADWSVVCPPGEYWLLQSIYATLATSAAVANRNPRLVLGDGTSTFLGIGSSAVLAASSTARYSFVRDGVYGGAATDPMAPLPELTIIPGWSVGSSTQLIDVADQWSAIALNVVATWTEGGLVDLADLGEQVLELVVAQAG